MNSLLLQSNFALTWAGDKGKSYQSRGHTINHAKCEQKFKPTKQIGALKETWNLGTLIIKKNWQATGSPV